MLNQHRISKSDDSGTKLVKAKNSCVYKNTACAKQCCLNFDQAKTQHIINAKISQARDFWKLLRGRKPTNHCLDVNDLYTYFKKLGNPADVHFIADDDVFEFIRLYDNGILVDSTDEMNVPITDSEVIQAIKQLKHYKSFGPDSLIKNH